MTQRTKRILAMLLALVFTAAIAAGCKSPDAAVEPAGGEPAAEVGAAEPATEVTGTAKTTLVTNGEAVTTCDPVANTAIQETIIQVNCYDTLVFPTASGEMIPWLAESWEISEDGLAYTFQLRKGVKFHNGEEFKASDVVFSMNRLMTMNICYANFWIGNYDYCEATDDYTVVFHLTVPNGPFISTLCRLYIVSEKEIMDNLDTTATTYGEFCDYGSNYLLTHDAGSGPFTVTDFSVENYVTCDAFADYWNGWEENAPGQFKIVFTKDETTMKTLFYNNELDISAPYQSNEFYEAADAIEGVDVVGYDTGMVQYMMFNCTMAPTDDANFRKGLCCLLDYDIMADLYYSAQPCKTYYGDNLPGAAILEDIYSYDPDKAAEYFAASKYADQLDEVVVKLQFHNAVADQEPLAIYVQSALAEAGIQSEIQLLPWVTIVDLCTSPETSPQASSVSVSANYWEAGSMIVSRYSSANVGTYENSEWLEDATLDSMIAAAIATPDDTSRYEQYKAITEYVYDLAPCALIASVLQTAAYHADYVYWPVAEMQKEGKTFSSPSGYQYYFRDCKLLPAA